MSPGEEPLLVANEASNDLAVIGTRDQRMLTLIPVGNRPRNYRGEDFLGRDGGPGFANGSPAPFVL